MKLITEIILINSNFIKLLIKIIITANIEICL